MGRMLAVLVSTISNSQICLLKKMRVAFANAKATHIFFSKNISIYAIFNDQNCNDTLSNDIVRFEQLGPNISNDQNFNDTLTNDIVRFEQLGPVH